MLPALAVALSVLNQPVPDWPAKPAAKWVQGTPATLSGLQGKVVLIRFFTDTTCPYCSEAAPVLNELHREFAGKGLVVLGVYTPKPRPRPVSAGEVGRTVREYRFEFPVVIDDDWGALRALWLDRVPDAEFTSASLLIDRHGVVRRVHEGGAYSKDDTEKMHEAIEKLLPR